MRGAKANGIQLATIEQKTCRHTNSPGVLLRIFAHSYKILSRTLILRLDYSKINMFQRRASGYETIRTNKRQRKKEIIMIIKRDLYLNRLVDYKNNGMVKIITGVRRCGKSYLYCRAA